MASELTSAPAKGAAAPKVAAIRGVAGSNRTWKLTQNKRTSASGRHGAANVVGNGVPFRVAMAKKQARSAVKDIEKRMHGERDARREELKAKRLEKARRRADGEMRAAQGQVLDGSKLKKMNKKQLRQVRKTRVNAQTGAVELVPAYS